jgi:hypothetical protein
MHPQHALPAISVFASKPQKNNTTPSAAGANCDRCILSVNKYAVTPRATNNTPKNIVNFAKPVLLFL